MHATEMKTKRHYTAPVTQRATVELEGGFCGSVIDSSTKTVNITSSAQDYETFENSTSINTGETDAAITWD